MKFDPTKPCKTKSGLEAKYLGHANVRECPKHNLSFLVNKKICLYTENGLHMEDLSPCDYDLLNIEEHMTQENKNYEICPECKTNIYERIGTLNGCTSGYKVCDCFEDTFEIKRKEKTQETKIDWSKPIECVSDTGKMNQARIISTGIVGQNYTIAVAIRPESMGESLYLCHNETGKLSIKEKEDKEFLGENPRIRNLPEPKPLEFVMGGVYKTRNSEAAIIFEKVDSTSYPWGGVIFNRVRFKWENWTAEGRLSVNLDEHDLIEKIGDIRDLHPSIAEMLK